MCESAKQKCPPKTKSNFHIFHTIAEKVFVSSFEFQNLGFVPKILDFVVPRLGFLIAKPLKSDPICRSKRSKLELIAPRF